jgi:hypothetical protein
MKIKKVLFLYICLSGIVLSGCITLDLREANHELVNLYRAKIEAINRGNAEQEVTINGALSVLADQADEKCDDVTTSQTNRIPFCRIAATAAWQAGNANVVKYANDGTSLCNDENYSKVPRDCGMLLIIPDFASVDELTRRYNEINGRVTADSNPPTKEEVVKLYGDIKSRIDSLLRKRNTIKQNSAYPKLLESLDRHTGTIFCRHLHDTLGLIVQYAGVGSAAHKEAQCDEYNLNVRLKKLGFSQQIAPCLPAGVPTKPSGCR